MFEKEFGFPNWLASAKFVTLTHTASDDLNCVEVIDGRKIIKSGAVFPKNDNTAIGIAYNKVDVTDGSQPIAILTHGVVHEERLPALVDNAAKAVLPLIQYRDYNPTEIRATALAIKTAPTKVTYSVDDLFDPKGTVLTITYDDGSTVDVAAADFADNYISYAPTSKMKSTVTKVTFTYKRGVTVATADQNITVS